MVLRAWRDDEPDRAAVDLLDEEARTYIGPLLPSSEPEAYRAWVQAREQAAAAGTGLSWCVADRRRTSRWA